MIRIGFAGLLFLVFLVLKLTHVIAWSWLLVTAPLWIMAGAWLLFWALLLIVAIYFPSSSNTRRK